MSIAPRGIIHVFRSLPIPTVSEPVALDRTSEELEAHFQRIVQSQHFLRAERLRDLLVYIWQHRGEPIGEYAIAIDGLGRREDFDPRSDASVRVQMSRLRRKLKDYYEEAGEPELLYIPTGSHQIAFTRLPAPVEEEVLPAPPPFVAMYLPQVLGAACALLFATTIWFWHARNLALAESAPRDAAVSFWSGFVGKNRPVKIILPTPAFYSFSEAKNLRLRATDVNDPGEMDKSPQFKALTRTLGTPSLEHAYTVTSDTLAALDLARYLDGVGLGKQVSVEVTSDSNTQALDHDDIVAFGTSTTLNPFREYLATMNFSLSAANGSVVTNAKPMPGEPSQYGIQTLGTTRTIQPSIVAVMPGRSAGYKLLLVQSMHTSAMVSFLTSQEGDRLVRNLLKSRGNLKFFEMVVLTEIEGNKVLRSWPTAVHAYTGSTP